MSLVLTADDRLGSKRRSPGRLILDDEQAIEGVEVLGDRLPV